MPDGNYLVAASPCDRITCCGYNTSAVAPRFRLCCLPPVPTAVVRWHSGGAPVRVRGSALKLLSLRHLWCNSCLCHFTFAILPHHLRLASVLSPSAASVGRKPFGPRQGPSAPAAQRPQVGASLADVVMWGQNGGSPLSSLLAAPSTSFD